MNLQIAFPIALAVAATSVPATAQPPTELDGFARVGVARVKLADDGPVFVDGVRDPGADYTTPDQWVANFDLGYFVLDPVAVMVSATTPGTTSNVPAGSLEGVPNLGDDTFSLFMLTATYHPLRGAPVSPYVGAGLAWQHIWDVDDGFASNLDIGDAVGPVVQGGVEVALDKRFGLFADGRFAWLENEASGNLGPALVTAEPVLNPFVLQAGILFRF
jgi:outer membrane protein W